MKKNILLGIILCLQSLSILYAQTIEKQQEIKLTIEKIPDTIEAGRAFLVEYLLCDPQGDKEELLFSLEDSGMAYPQKTSRSFEMVTEGYLTTWNEKEIKFNYLFVPLQEGEIKLPRAFVETESGRHWADEYKITVLPPTDSLRQLTTTLKFPTTLKEREKFDLTVIVEGDCPDSLMIYLPFVQWLKDKRYNYADKLTPKHVVKTKTRHEYTYSLRAMNAGTYTLPGVVIYIPFGRGTYTTSHHIENIVIEKDETPIDQITLTTVLPDSIIQGIPFSYSHQMSGSFKNINKIFYPEPCITGLDSLKTPEKSLIDYYSFPLENKEDQIDFIEYALINTNRATQPGKMTIPSLHVIVDGKEYISEPTTITVLPNPEKPKISLTFTQNIPKRAIVDKEFWIETKIHTYSGYFDNMKAEIETFEKAISDDFIIVEQKKSIDRRTEKSHSIQAYSEYKWLLKPRKTGKVIIPSLRFTIEEQNYSTDKEQITILETPDKEDVEIIHDKAIVLGNSGSLKIGLKDSNWELYEWQLPDLTQYGFDSPKPDEEEIVRRVNSSGTYHFTPLKEGDLTIPPILLKTDKGEFYTDSIHIKVLPEDTHPINSSSGNIKEEDVFTSFGLTKKKVYINEPIVFVERIYSRLEMTTPYPQMTILDWENFYPDTGNRFDVSESFAKMNENKRIERINDRNYKIYDIRKTLLFVSEFSGINPMSIRHVYTFRNPEEETGKNKKITWPIKGTVTFPLEVMPLPLENQPQSFDGLLGNYHIHAELSGQVLTRNTSLLLTIQIRGKGNAHQLENKTLSFETQDVEYELMNEEIRIKEITQEGIEAVKIYEYAVKAAKKGKYIIPSIELSYFDYTQEKYIIQQTEPIIFNKK